MFFLTIVNVPFRTSVSWFTKLPPNFVDSYATLMSKFETQFSTNLLHHLTSSTLVGIRQRRESL